jgi:lipopolysaccharide/colanic/teichoic acid biosynthesis glycosyltransferase
MVVLNRTALSAAGAGVAPRRDLDPVKSDIEYLGDIIGTAGSRIPSLQDRIKRGFDIVFGAVALVFLSPVILVAAVLIKAESKGPVFFMQERIGLNRRSSDRRSDRSGARFPGADRRRVDRRKEINAGKPFSIYKLRTMRTDAEKEGPALSSKGDPRITRVGSFMRRTRIDEIPQFINVIKGDMSIIGPRPERSFYINMVRQDIPEFPLRLRVKPGITGLAQVENGYANTVDEMADKLFFDLKYISEFSLLQEVKILFKTVFVVVSGKGAC